MAPPAKKRPVPAVQDSDDEISVGISRPSRSPSRPSPDRLYRYQQGTVREALGLGSGRQKASKSKYSLAEDLKLIKYVCTEGVKKYDGALCGYGIIMDFCLAYPEVGNRHTEQSLHNRLRTIKKNINTFNIEDSWKDLLRPQPSAARQAKKGSRDAITIGKPTNPTKKTTKTTVNEVIENKSAPSGLASGSSNHIRGAYHSLASKKNVEAGASGRRTEDISSDKNDKIAEQVVFLEDSEDELEERVTVGTSSTMASRKIPPLPKNSVKRVQLDSPNDSHDEDEVSEKIAANKPARGPIRLYSSDESQEEDVVATSRREVTVPVSRRAVKGSKNRQRFSRSPSHGLTAAPSGPTVKRWSVSQKIFKSTKPSKANTPEKTVEETIGEDFEKMNIEIVQEDTHSSKQPETVEKVQDTTVSPTPEQEEIGNFDPVFTEFKPAQRPRFTNEILNVTLPEDSDDENLIDVARASASVIVKKKVRILQKKRPKLESLCSSDDSQYHIVEDTSSASEMEEASVAPPVDSRQRSPSPEFPFRPPTAIVHCTSQADQQPVSSTPMFVRPISPKIVNRICESSSSKTISTLPVNWDISPVESTGLSVAATTTEGISAAGTSQTSSHALEEDRKAVEIFSKFFKISSSQVLFALFVNNNSPLFAVEWMIKKGLNLRPDSPISREVDLELLRGGEKAVERLASSTQFSLEDLQTRLRFLRLGQADLAQAQLPEETLEKLVLEIHKHRFAPPEISET